MRGAILFLYIGGFIPIYRSNFIKTVGNIASYLSIVVWGATLTLVSKCASILPLHIVGLTGVMPGVAQVGRNRFAPGSRLCRFCVGVRCKSLDYRILGRSCKRLL